jgi:hypothetical protein
MPDAPVFEGLSALTAVDMLVLSFSVTDFQRFQFLKSRGR